jgi:hypothetical protein
MRTRWTLGVAVSFLPVMSFSAELQAPEDSEALLQRIRSTVAQHLSRLPNYTCHEVIERLIQPFNSSAMGQHDRVEVEVALVGERELFARPGESHFEEQSITKLVPVGTIGDGNFFSHADSIFLGDAASFHYVGVFKKDGHKAYRYDFQVPQENSHFLVKHGSAQGLFAYHGSFWADLETLELVRLEIKVDHIPSFIGVRFVAEKMRYTMMRIGDSEFLLPRHSEMDASDNAGNYSLNTINLEQCHEFKGDSVVTFTTPSDDASADRSAPDQ